jgi:hypothetical protein
MELPVYKIKIDMEDEATGLTAVSLVDYPAVEKDFLLFDKQTMLFSADDDKQIISGIALLADTPIYRRNEHGEFYVVFEKETIRQLVEKYSKQGLLNVVNLQHRSDTFVSGVYMIESYLIDKQRGICPVEFQDVKDGSWFVSYYVEDKNLWNEIKNGDIFNGFSVEISAHLEMSKMESNNQKDSMNKFFKLAKMLLKLGEVKTDKETLIIDGELEVGKPVVIETEEGPVPAADGEYTAEDGTVIVVVEGVIAEIRPVEEEKPEEQSEQLEEEEKPVEEEKTAEIDELKAEIERLNSVIAEKDAEIETLKAQVAEQEEKLKMSVETPLTKKNKIVNKENKALKYFS